MWTDVNQQYPFNEDTPTGFWELHANKCLIANSPKKPLKVVLFNTELDIGYDLPERTFHNWTRANTRMAATLKAKGYGRSANNQNNHTQRVKDFRFKLPVVR